MLPAKAESFTVGHGHPELCHKLITCIVVVLLTHLILYFRMLSFPVLWASLFLSTHNTVSITFGYPMILVFRLLGSSCNTAAGLAGCARDLTTARLPGDGYPD